MDADTRTLIERTRQRREILNQRFAGVPEAAPRKRRTPVLEKDGSEKVVSSSADQDDSPKRPCLRDVELNVKQDTPAIKGVQSRIHDLKWEAENTEDDAPTPKPRKSVSSPPLERRQMSPVKVVSTPTGPSSARKSRFAALAQNINNWEDDMTHHIIHKEEEKKPKWQPPPKMSSPAPSTKGPAPVGPVSRGAASPVKAATGSPKKSVGGRLSSMKPVTSSPTKSINSVSSSASSPQVAMSRDTQSNNVTADTTKSPKKTQAPSAPALARNSPLRSSKAPTSNLSASTPAAIHSSTYRPGAPLSSADAVDPVYMPLSQRMSHMQEKLDKKRQDEPTAYSVGARMSAWEDMTAANKVSHIKKVNPGQSTPHTGSKPKQAPASATKVANAGLHATPKSASAPAKMESGDPENPPPPPPLLGKGVTPSKSFRETIEEKAAEVAKRTGLQYASGSPSKAVQMAPKSPSVMHSPNKVSVGTRGVQQRLAEQIQESGTTCSQLAAQKRAERAAELAALSNRWKNGILREDGTPVDEAPVSQTQAQPKTPSTGSRDVKREKARADFKSKLAEIGLDEGNAAPKVTPQKTESVKSNTASIYNLIKKREEATPSKPEETKKVKFNDSFDDSEDECERKIPKSASKRMPTNPSGVAEEKPLQMPADKSMKVSTECADDSNSESIVSDRNSMEVTDDDISLKGFVSEAVRRESIIALRHKRQALHKEPSTSSLDSYEDDDERAAAGSMEGLESLASTASSSASYSGAGYGPDDDSMEDDEDEDNSTKRKAVNDLLDDAFDDTIADDYDPDMDVNNVVLRKRQPQRSGRDDDYDPDMDINNVVMRKKNTQPAYNTNSMELTEDDDDDNRPYSLQAYRKSASIQQHMMAPVVRSSKYVGKPVVEEDIPMPHASQQPRVDDRRAVQERIKELKELVQQEQSVIMQTSNALNKCCVGNPVFAGSAEQVECNRLLLLACQKRQCYMTEIERLRATAQLSPDGPGPRGSITISDIRLPLKKDFVTKIGTSHDTTTHFFILLIRNGSQLICTQMLSTHDPMMRGSLDFPNLIKINGITGNFKLTMDIYSMNVSREAATKDKKKKTPKKLKGGFPLESPGGPSAVRTTSFSHVTSLELTKKSLDKSSFHLERLSYLSPLYGQIFMRLKCLMESNVEERGFLTMFDDVSGFGAWHRRWCVLTGNKICIWKYPDDETRKDPMAMMDLKRCVSDKVGLVSRDVCARPNTFEMVTVRPPLRGEQDTLVTRTYNSTTSVRYLMSADSKEERIVWCNKINRTLANLRTWNADALKPMRPPPASTSGGYSVSSSRR